MAHPYMANSAPGLADEMLAQTGYANVAELFAQLPAEHRTKQELRLPERLDSEAALRRHLTEVLGRNTSCEDALSFLGAGSGGGWFASGLRFLPLNFSATCGKDFAIKLPRVRARFGDTVRRPAPVGGGRDR